MDLINKILEGNEASAARLITMIEEGKEDGYEVISQLLPYTGNAHVIGVTGAPGAGKSSIVDKLAVNFSALGKKIGIIAIDPTSTKSNGAFLGDRVRMGGAEKIEGVFIRSMAHRGYPGGIARATVGAIYVLEGLGKDIIIVESVGAGQTEIQISSVCDTVITIFTPDYGDEIQLMKAGVIEIGDIIVINKSDMPGAEEAAKDISAHAMSGNRYGWQMPVVMTQAQKGDGLKELVEAIVSHRKYLQDTGSLIRQRAEKIKKIMLSFLKEEIWADIIKKWSKRPEFMGIVDMLEKKELDVYHAVSRAAKMIISEEGI